MPLISERNIRIEISKIEWDKMSDEDLALFSTKIENILDMAEDLINVSLMELKPVSKLMP